jgi:predicted lipoprotein with Yx(FWY)xxD motif
MAMRNRWWARLLAAGLGAGAVALIAACGSSGTPSASQSATSGAAGGGASASASSQSGSHAASVTIMTFSTSKGTVLTNAQGMTLYWFTIDTPTTSKCSGACATFWPPVIGTATAAAGQSLPKGFGTITRSDGQTQATYAGHPLYTYMGDTAAGQINGNDKNLSGGLWWAMTPNGAKLASSGSGGSGGSGGGGFGGY